jgi:hypothetical protein
MYVLQVAENETSVQVMEGLDANVTLALIDGFGPLPLHNCDSDSDAALRRDILRVFGADNDSSRLTPLCSFGVADLVCTGAWAIEGGSRPGQRTNLTLSSDRGELGDRIAVQIVVIECLPGFVNIGNRCELCQPGTYAVLPNSTVCRSCPADAVCAGGKAVVSKNGTFIVWTPDSADVEVLHCMSTACRGGSLTDLSVRNECAPNRTGLLCASCIDPSAAPVGDGCVECPETNTELVWLLAAGVLFAAVVLHALSNKSNGKVQLLFFYSQVVVVVLPTNFSADVIFGVFNLHASATTGSLGGRCVANVDHYAVLLIRLVLPLGIVAALLLLMLVARGFLLVRARLAARRASGDYRLLLSNIDDAENGEPVEVKNEKEVELEPSILSWRRFFRTLIAVGMLTFSTSLKATLDLINCRQIGRQSVLRSDVRVPCGDSLHSTWSSVAFFGLLPYLVASVVAVPTSLWLLRRRHGALPERSPLAVLFEVYRPEVAVWWEGVVLLRRLSIGLIDILFSDSGVRSFVLNTVNVVSLAATLQLHPLRAPDEHWLDVGQQIALLVVGNNFGALEQRNGPEIGNSALLLAVVATPAVVIGGSIAWAHGKTLWTMWRRKRTKKQEETH